MTAVRPHGGAAQLTAARPYDGYGTWPDDHE
jgi:hypothetical protein